ncbi:MAG TPA: metallophosphoesterase [Drouetiella sp.]
METSKPLSAFVVVVTIFVVSLLIWYGGDHPAHVPPGNFIAKPYLQLGSGGGLAIVWQVSGEDTGDTWTLEVRRRENSSWEKVESIHDRVLHVDSIEPYHLLSADVTNLGITAFDYRVLKNEQPVFSAHANPRVEAPDKYHFAVMGDCGADTIAQRKIAYQLLKAKPNFILITGDSVYDGGRASEYLHHFFPIYNNESADPTKGAPLIRSTLMSAVPGNHDIANSSIFDTRNMAIFPDSLAYFYEWLQPLNGPDKAGGKNTPVLLHNPQRQATFLTAAGVNYPAMANFYFDLGNARFIMLDANPYMDWSDPAWRKWLEDTLTAASSKQWRFVVYHQTAFNSDTTHFSEQRMRLISDILEKHKVRIVFAGHVHNYQRTYPLHFQPGQMDSKGLVPGIFEIASKGTAPHEGEIVYITTGGGGGHLSGGTISQTPSGWQPFTDRFIANTHSFTLCEVDGGNLSATQISEDGTVLDRFSVANRGSD